MLPSAAKNQEAMPDLILWIDDKALEENMDTIDQLRRGSVVKFSGFMHRMHSQIKQHARNTAHFEDSYPHLRMKKIELMVYDDTVG